MNVSTTLMNEEEHIERIRIGLHWFNRFPSSLEINRARPSKRSIKSTYNASVQHGRLNVNGSPGICNVQQFSRTRTYRFSCFYVRYNV